MGSNKRNFIPTLVAITGLALGLSKGLKDLPPYMRENSNNLYFIKTKGKRRKYDKSRIRK